MDFFTYKEGIYVILFHFSTCLKINLSIGNSINHQLIMHPHGFRTLQPQTQPQ